MKQVFFLTGFLVLAIMSFAQNNSASEMKKHAPNLATILTTEGKTLKGWIYRLDDNKIVLLPGKDKNFRLTSLAKTNDQSINIDAEQIQSISIRKKGSELKGPLIGLVVGSTIGALIGFSKGDTHGDSYSYYDYSSGFYFGGVGGVPSNPDSRLVFVDDRNKVITSAGLKAQIYGFSLGLIGALVGTLISSIPQKFIIGGDKKVYHDLQGDLMKKLIVQ